MSMLSRLGFARDVLTAATSSDSPEIPNPPARGISSDRAQVATLPQEVAQAFGIYTDTDYVTEQQAMSIPAVRAGYWAIAGKIGSSPLVCVRERAGASPERVTRPFITQPDPNAPRVSTITDTIGSLIFYGYAWWQRTQLDYAGFPYNARWVHPSRVTLDHAAGIIRFDGKPVDPASMLYFRAPDMGLLYHGARTLKTALMLEQAVRTYARLDVPLGLIEDETGAMLVDEIQEFLDSWETARKSRTTGYLPVGLKYTNPGFNAQQLELGDARAFQSAEIARLLNMPASIINAPSSDSLTYATTIDNARQLVTQTFSPYTAALEGRLSMPDITPAGTTVFVDFADFLRGDTKTVVETGAAAVAAGLMTVDEVRQDWLHLGPHPGGSSNGTETAAPG